MVNLLRGVFRGLPDTKRMTRIYQCHKARGIYMSVELGRSDIGVAEQRLEHTQISPALKQMRSKGMAQHMGTDLFGIDPGT